MSKLNVDQKTIKALLSDNKADFLIPDYQRPYAWDAQKECCILWEDLFAFAIPDGNADKFDRNTAEYYLGPIVTFKNDRGQMEIIDGQQRLTTIMLLLRAFYSRFEKMKDDKSQQLREMIGKCIWKTDEFDQPDMTQLKINSEVATDNDKGEFLSILEKGEVTEDMKSRYAENFRFFEKQVADFVNSYASYTPFLPSRILNNCIILPIEADVQDTALRIFSTLNNRGKALSDADIFKAEFYKAFSKMGRKDEFISRWKKLEELCNKYLRSLNGTPMDEIFIRYMYYERSKMGIKLSTTEALRTFFGANNYALLQKEETLSNLELLAKFWCDVYSLSDERFSSRVLRQLYLMNYAPNSMWTSFVSVYFLCNKDENDMLDDDKFYSFLTISSAFIWTYAITNPGVNALRTPVYAEMVKIQNGEDVDFADFKFPIEQTRRQFANYNFFNGRPITKSMLMWWLLHNAEQELPSDDTVFEIEHIYAKNRYDQENSLSDKKYVEYLGNKSVLEKRINIRASDYRFTDKKKYYLGYTTAKGEAKRATCVEELKHLANNLTDFSEQDILDRTNQIIDAFCDYLSNQGLTKE